MVQKRALQLAYIKQKQLLLCHGKRADLCNPTRRAVLWRTPLYTVDVGGENKGS